MRVAMIGTGYVGLVSGACFADFGHEVICVDKDKEKIAALTRGEMPIYEPGLNDVVTINARAGRLKFTTELSGAVADADAVFIAVGTPSRRGDGFADLSFVYDAAREIARRSTALPLSSQSRPFPSAPATRSSASSAKRGLTPTARWCPIPSSCAKAPPSSDFKHPDRIVIGTTDTRAREVMSELYRPLYLNRSPILFTGRRTAELIKYAANAFLATKITFINEIADLAEKVGADVQEIARGIGLDNRIGSKFLHAGPGYGGSCFPKDTVALIKTAQDHAAPLRIVEAVAAVNDARKRAMARKVSAALGGELRGKTVAVLGLTFKPNTDDMREAPSIPLITALQDMGAKVRAYDPVGMEQAKSMISNVTFCNDAYSCAEGASALVIVTEWEQFRALDFERLKTIMAQPVLVDLRNVYRPDEIARHGFVYESIGRASSAKANMGPSSFRVVAPAKAAGTLNSRRAYAFRCLLLRGVPD